MAQMTFSAGSYTAQTAKPLPVILLLDTSLSMKTITDPENAVRTGEFAFEDGQAVEYVRGGTMRITVLNKCVKRMLDTLASFERDATEFLVAIITFGADTRVALKPIRASEARFTPLTPAGDTPLGKALEVAKTLIEDRSQIPHRCYRPLVVLVSDGQPNDDWEGRLSDFIHEGLTSNCDRAALAIGSDANREMLARFVEGTENGVSEAETAAEITKFFKYVTLSTINRTKSQNTNASIPADEARRLVQKSESQQNNDDDDDDPWYN